MKRGLSLIETISAIFLLLLAMLLTFQLFHVGMQYFRRVEERTVALTLADQRLEEVRNWSLTQNNWSGPPNGQNPAYPGYQYQVILEDARLASPSLELDTNFTQKRELTETAKKVTVRVSWPRGQVETHSLLVDRGNRGWDSSQPIRINISGGVPAVVTASTSISMTAKAYDASGAELKDMFFTWYVEPQPPDGALGTVTASRDGRSATFVNQAVQPDGSTGPSTGQCQVAVRAVYEGVEQWAYSPDFNLAP